MQQLSVKTKAIFYFYRTVIWLNLAASLAVVRWMLPEGLHNAIIGLVWIKFPVFGLVLLTKHLLYPSDYYFYYNLQLSKPRLWLYSFFMDVLLYLSIVFLYSLLP